MSDDGGSKDLWNVGKLLPDYTVLQPRRQPSSYSPPWEPQILTKPKFMRDWCSSMAGLRDKTQECLVTTLTGSQSLTSRPGHKDRDDSTINMSVNQIVIKVHGDLSPYFHSLRQHGEQSITCRTHSQYSMSSKTSRRRAECLCFEFGRVTVRISAHNPTTRRVSSLSSVSTGKRWDAALSRHCKCAEKQKHGKVKVKVKWSRYTP
jgi:hypothetical protein